jgi:hypothetical protein
MVDDEPVQRVHGETAIGHWSLLIGEADKSEIEDIIKNLFNPLICPGPRFFGWD